MQTPQRIFLHGEAHHEFAVIAVRLYTRPMLSAHRCLPLVAFTLAIPRCACDEEEVPEPEADLYEFRELHVMQATNMAQREVHRFEATKHVDTLLVEPRWMTEQVELSNRLDLIVILDSSCSMTQENSEFLHDTAREFLDRMGGGQLEDADLQVRFVGPGPAGPDAKLSFRNLVTRRAIRDTWEEDQDGNRTYRYIEIREKIREYVGLASQEELQQLLIDTDPGFQDPRWTEWDAALIPVIFGTDDFDMVQGAASLPEWFELSVRTGLSGGGGDQGYLLGSLLRYLEVRPDGPDFPRKDSLLAVMMITDDQEDAVYDPESGAFLDWEEYANDTCAPSGDETTFDAVQDCKNDRYAAEALAHARLAAQNPSLRAFSVTCGDELAPANRNWALRAQDVVAGVRFRPTILQDACEWWRRT